MRVLGATGDKRIAWDPLDDIQVRKARARFTELLGQQYKAWRMSSDGTKGEPITEFDQEAGAILVAPPMAGG